MLDSGKRMLNDTKQKNSKKRHASSARAASSSSSLTDGRSGGRIEENQKGCFAEGEAVSGCGPAIGRERSRGCYDEMELPRSSKHTE